MHRWVFPSLLLAAFGLLAAGCGGAGTATTTAMTPTDPTMTRSTTNAATTSPELAYKLTPGANTALGPLKALSPKSELDKPAGGKVDKDSTAKLAKLGKDGLKFDTAYNYYVADASAPRAAVGDSGATVPLPADAKANPDGTYWIVDADTRRLLTLSGVKHPEGKPATVAEAPSADLVHPATDVNAPALALVARSDEASMGVTHALRIVVKGLGAEGAPTAGARVRLKKGVSEKDVPILSRALVRALKKYGAVLSPGTDGPALSALSDVRWTKDDTKAIAALHLSDFELLASPDKTAKTAPAAAKTADPASQNTDSAKNTK